MLIITLILFSQRIIMSIYSQLVNATYNEISSVVKDLDISIRHSEQQQFAIWRPLEHKVVKLNKVVSFFR